MKTAPIQNSVITEIPWEIHVRAWQVYAALGHGNQSAQRIAERGGFGSLELIILLAERNPWSHDYGKLNEYQQVKLNELRIHRAEEDQCRTCHNI